MLSELFIENYRGIKNLELGSLGKINIIAGANNTGKTSILEIIRSMEAPNDIRKWRMISRRESSNVIGTRISAFDLIDSVFSFDINGEENFIRFAGKMDEESFDVRIKRHVYDTYVPEGEVNRLRGYSIVLNENMEDLQVDQVDIVEREARAMDLTYLVNGVCVGEDTLYDVASNPVNYDREKEDVKIVEPVIYVSPVQHAQNQLYLKSTLTDPEMFEQFVEIMRQFDPGFLSINSVDGKYVVLSKNHREGLILNAYGDGMKKAMLLLSAVIRAKNGILLLDEFETAIHVSAMKSVFEWIIKTAVALNVQIFMTSHSIEAIESVLKCSPELQEVIRMITLVKVDDQLKVRNVSGEKAVQLLDEYGLELR